MCAAVYEGLIPERPDPFRRMTDLAVFDCQTPLHLLRILRFDMKLAGTVAHFAACILQMGRLFRTDKAAGFAIPRRMAEIAFLYLIISQAFSNPIDAPKRRAFFRIGHKIPIFAFVTFFAGI